MPLHVSSTIVLIIRRSKLYYTAYGIVTHCRWPDDRIILVNDQLNAQILVL